MKALVKTRPEPGIWPGSVPILAQLVNGMRRVCKPGGEIYIVNHYQHASPVVSAIERMMVPFSSLMGFHPDFSMEHFVEETRLDVVEKIPVNLFGYWTLLRARNNKISLAQAAASRTGAA